MFDNNQNHELDGNRLLSALSDGNRYLLSPYFQEVELSKGQILDDQKENASDRYAYFPIDSIISLTSTTEDERMELAMVGFDGATGVYNALGFNSLQYKSIVQVAGRACRIESAVLREQFRRNTGFSLLLMQYLHALYAQITQVAICYRRHRAQQRLQTWMTMMFNRLKITDLKMKQDEIADTLGYTRQTISSATAALQETGIIRYSRGYIKLLDRERLGHEACECYSIMESHYAQIAPSAASKSDSSDTASEPSLTELTSLYIEQLGSAINNVREICSKNDSVFERQREILNLTGKMSVN